MNVKQKEKTVLSYLRKAERLLNLQEKLLSQKKKKLASLNKEIEIKGDRKTKIVHIKNFHKKGFLHNWLNKRKKEELFKDVGNELDRLWNIIKRQKKTLGSELRTTNYEETLLTELQKIPDLANLPDKEKAILEEFISKEGSTISESLDILNEYHMFINKQMEDTKKAIETYNDKKHGKRLELGLKFNIEREEDRLKKLKSKIEYCKAFCSRTMEEQEEKRKRREKEIKKLFNPDDLAEVMHIAKEEIDNERDKKEAIQRFLYQQRKVRNPLNVKQLIAVHATKYFPNNGIIKTPGNFVSEYEVDGKKHKWILPRETIHFALNGLVTEHTQGAKWESMPFAIMIPLDRIIKKCSALLAADTFVIGDLKIPKGSEIMLNERYDEKRFQKLKNKSGNAKIVFLKEDENLREGINRRIKERGYTPIKGGFHSWNYPELVSEKEIKEIIESFGFKDFNAFTWSEPFDELSQKTGIRLLPHEDSIWHEAETIAQNSYAVLNHPEKFSGGGRNIREEVLRLKQKIPEIMVKLAREFNKWPHAEAKESHKRMRKNFKKIYKNLKESYPQYFKKSELKKAA